MNTRSHTHTHTHTHIYIYSKWFSVICAYHLIFIHVWYNLYKCSIRRKKILLSVVSSVKYNTCILHDMLSKINCLTYYIWSCL